MSCNFQGSISSRACCEKIRLANILIDGLSNIQILQLQDCKLCLLQGGCWPVRRFASIFYCKALGPQDPTWAFAKTPYELNQLVVHLQEETRPRISSLHIMTLHVADWSERQKTLQQQYFWRSHRFPGNFTWLSLGLHVAKCMYLQRKTLCR